VKLWRLFTLSLCLAAGLASAQGFPDKSKPLKMIVPSGAGSTGDVVARAYGRAITEVSGWPVVVENKPGAEGVIGLQAVKSSPADGYTIMMTSNSTQVLNVHMLPSVPYDPVADFVPLVGTGRIALVMYVGAGTPFRTVNDFVTAAKASPGKYTFGSNTATGRLAAELVEHLAGIKLLPVPYKTLPEVFTAVGSGELDMGFGTEASAAAFYKAGRVRPLAVSGSSRLKGLPDVPTLQEAGLRDYEFDSWLATFAPAGTPAPVAASLRDILRRAGRTQVVADMRQTFALDPMDIGGDELMAMQRNEIARWGKLLRAMAPKK